MIQIIRFEVVITIMVIIAYHTPEYYAFPRGWSHKKLT
jgi:hypothetical protein